MIEVDQVSKVFGRGPTAVAALQDVSLQVASGAIHGIIGQSGAGKSTLIRCINRLETVTSGSIRVDGEEITRMQGAPLRRARQQMGMIFQGFNLLGGRTVAGNVALSLEIAGVPREARRARVRDLLHLTGIEERAAAHPAQLSGGQKQRVGIARALATSPSVLLSDEATSALDPATTRTILDLLKALNRDLGLTILLITHEMDVIKRICDQVTVLEDGLVVESGNVNDLALRPSSRVSTALFARPRSWSPGTTRQVTVPVGDDRGAALLFAELSRRFAIEPRVTQGSIEEIGDRHIGQFVLEMDADAAASSDAVAWIEQAYPGAVVS